jgi:hypothetical protein
MNPYQRTIDPLRKPALQAGREHVLHKLLKSAALAAAQKNAAYDALFVQELMDADDTWDEFRLVHCNVDPSTLGAWSNFFGAEQLAQRWVEVERADKTSFVVRVRFAWYLRRAVELEQVEEEKKRHVAHRLLTLTTCRALPLASALALLALVAYLLM